MTFFVPESPSFKHDKGSQEEFDESRRTLEYVASYNGVDYINGLPYSRFKFAKEFLWQKQKAESADDLEEV